MLHRAICAACLSAAAVLSIPAVSSAAVIAGWDFQTTSAGGTAVAAAPAVPTLILANAGTGAGSAAMYLNGTNFSSSWFQPASGTTGTELNGFAGTALNAQAGMSTTTSGVASLALLGGTSNSANGKSAVFSFDMTGYTILDVSYATQRTGTGFTSQAWSYSTDGSTWLPVKTFGTTDIPAAFATLTLPSIAVSDVSTMYLMLTVDGASSASGNNRLDNIVLNGSVPEPASASLLGVGLLAVARRRRA